MASQPEKSALILNRIVKAVDRYTTKDDRLLSAVEMALGQPLAERTLDVCFGGISTEPRELANKFDPVVVGRATARRSDSLLPLPVPTNTSTLETSISADDLLGAGSVADAYAFGSAFLMTHEVGNEFVGLVQASMARGGTGFDENVIYIARDMTKEAVVELARQGGLTINVPWAGGEVDPRAIELFKFVLDIGSYTFGDQSQTDVKALVIDSRSPRGWGGFANEAMAAALVAPLVASRVTEADVTTRSELALYKLVLEWVNLSCWTPDFLTFWAAHASYMDDTRLKQYLLEELNIAL